MLQPTCLAGMTATSRGPTKLAQKDSGSPFHESSSSDFAAQLLQPNDSLLQPVVFKGSWLAMTVSITKPSG